MRFSLKTYSIIVLSLCLFANFITDAFAVRVMRFPSETPVEVPSLSEADARYLKLSGGTLTGDVSLNDGSGNSPILTFSSDTGSGNGWSIRSLASPTDTLSIIANSGSSRDIWIGNTGGGSFTFDLVALGNSLLRAYDLTVGSSSILSGNTYIGGTQGVLLTASTDGDWTWKGQGNGNDEDLKWNLDDGVGGANTVEVTSTTGVTRIDFTSIGSRWTTLDDNTISTEDDGHIETKGTAPSLSSCGTTPSISTEATDMAGKITIGAGVAVTSCTMTFSTEWDVAPPCVVNNGTQVLATEATTTTSTLILTTAVTMDEDVISYICLGNE